MHIQQVEVVVALLMRVSRQQYTVSTRILGT
jgi:hypothetical protein